MNFLDAVRAGLTKFLSIKGRASRSEFWYYQLFVIVFSAALVAASVGIHALAPTVDQALGIAFWLAYATMGLTSYASIARRLHDRNRSAWHVLWMFAPVFGPLVILIWCCKKGVAGDNHYGKDPLRIA
jgi:uncharacterized membrane protein YhaH (DUF805 family)